MYVASNLKYLRARKGWKQSDLARHLGKTSAAISEYEKGKSLPPLDVAYKIGQIFDVTVDDLFGNDLHRAEILREADINIETPHPYRARYEKLQEQFRIQKRLTRLQEQRLAELEREIREHAPELAERLGLEV